MPTGTGKTRVAMLAIEQVYPISLLIIVPTTALQEQWRPLVEKAGFADVEIVCINTARTWVDCNFDMVVCDEVHTMLSVENRKFFLKNSCERLLCLTATPPEHQQYLLFLQTIAPIRYEMKVQQAQEENLVAPSKIYNVAVDLTAGEQTEYDQHDKMFRKAMDFMGGWEQMQRFLGNKRAYEAFCEQQDTNYSAVRSWPYLAMQAVRKRKEVLYNANEKINKTLAILQKHHDRKAVVFCETIEMAERVYSALGEEQIGTQVYHSKLKKKHRQSIIDAYVANHFRVLVTVKALDAGLDVKGISLAIVLAGTSKQLQTIQRFGRALRKEQGKQTIIAQLYCKDTQEERWITQRSEGFEVKWV